MEEVERRAEEVLADLPKWVWDRTEPPVPVEEIADSCFGLHVREVEDMTSAPGAPMLEPDQSLSGLLLTGRREIWVNAAEAQEWPSRRRFTIGHELGHWVMHRTGNESLFCRSTTVQPGEADEAAVPDIEEEASVFAAALLMPPDLIRRYYREFGGDFERLCQAFNCSGAAMGRRLHAVI